MEVKEKGDLMILDQLIGHARYVIEVIEKRAEPNKEFWIGSRIKIEFGMDKKPPMLYYSVFDDEFFW